MFGLFGSSAPAIPTYPELSAPTTAEEYKVTADKAKTTLLEVLNNADGWSPMDSPVAGIELKTKSVEGSPAHIARAETTLDIPVARLVAETSGTDGEYYKSQEEDILAWKVIKTIDEKNHIIYTGHKTPFPVTDRELCFLRTTHTLEDGRTLVCAVSINSDVATEDKRVRAVVLAGWLFRPDGDSKTHVTRLIQLDPKGNVPGFLINAQQAKAATAINILKTAASK